MTSKSSASPHRTGRPAARLGVGIDTSRYGHHAAFLADDLQPAAAELSFPESAHGYAQLQKRLELLAQSHPGASFAVRLDVAGQYADNLLHFLHRLADRSGPAPTPPPRPPRPPPPPRAPPTAQRTPVPPSLVPRSPPPPGPGQPPAPPSAGAPPPPRCCRTPCASCPRGPPACRPPSASAPG